MQVTGRDEEGPCESTGSNTFNGKVLEYTTNQHKENPMLRILSVSILCMFPVV